jgi:hypothetical protein
MNRVAAVGMMLLALTACGEDGMTMLGDGGTDASSHGDAGDAAANDADSEVCPVTATVQFLCSEYCMWNGAYCFPESTTCMQDCEALAAPKSAGVRGAILDCMYMEITAPTVDCPGSAACWEIEACD